MTPSERINKKGWVQVNALSRSWDSKIAIEEIGNILDEMYENRKKSEECGLLKELE